MIFDTHARTDAEMLPHLPALHFLAHCLLDVLHVPCEERDGVNTSICFVIDRRCASFSGCRDSVRSLRITFITWAVLRLLQNRASSRSTVHLFASDHTSVAGKVSIHRCAPRNKYESMS